MRKDAFGQTHPAVELFFFLAVMLITAFVLHPAVTGISLAAACAYNVYLRGRKALLFTLCFVLPFILLIAVLNPLFNHAGVTVLFYLHNGNAVTLEAVLYGIVSACMFAALISWCSCLNAVMSSDKYVCLFGRAIPVLSLLFSMVLRFVPRFTARIGLVSAAQKSTCPEMGKSPVKALKHGVSVLSFTTSWALESSVVMADSMKSRGYGLPGRTSYSIYRFDSRDAVLAALLAAFCVVSIAAMVSKRICFRFYPSIKYSSFGALSAAGYAAFALLCLLPLLLDILENVRWHSIRSKI
ncbi:MAG: energy-coupling factor transporter transmembrane protein EcfT [Clostridiales bacterium]|nr:energy-coupling factor transporter transmembrane protein EcfT [Clostridiales bacterium]